MLVETSFEAVAILLLKLLLMHAHYREANAMASNVFSRDLLRFLLRVHKLILLPLLPFSVFLLLFFSVPSPIEKRRVEEALDGRMFQVADF